MRALTNRRSQRGVATILVSMIMLILITLMVVTAFTLSTTNLKAIGNMQMREEATNAAEKFIEQTINGTFWDPTIATPPFETTYAIGGSSYDVTIAAPTCLRAKLANITTTSSVSLPGFSSAAAYNTIWLLDATAISDKMGARVRVRQGVRVLMSEPDKDTYCPT